MGVGLPQRARCWFGGVPVNGEQTVPCDNEEVLAWWDNERGFDKVECSPGGRDPWGPMEASADAIWYRDCMRHGHPFRLLLPSTPLECDNPATLAWWVSNVEGGKVEFVDVGGAWVGARRSMPDDAEWFASAIASGDRYRLVPPARSVPSHDPTTAAGEDTAPEEGSVVDRIADRMKELIDERDEARAERDAALRDKADAKKVSDMVVALVCDERDRAQREVAALRNARWVSGTPRPVPVPDEVEEGATEVTWTDCTVTITPVESPPLTLETDDPKLIAAWRRAFGQDAVEVQTFNGWLPTKRETKADFGREIRVAGTRYRLNLSAALVSDTTKEPGQ